MPMTAEERKNCRHTKTTFSTLSGGQCCDDCGFMLDPLPSAKDDDDGEPVATPAWAAPMPSRTAPYPLGEPADAPVAPEPEAPASRESAGVAVATEWLDCTHIGPVWETQTRLIKVRGGAAVQEYRHRGVEIEMIENNDLRSWRLFSNQPWKKGEHKTMRGGPGA
jgi:hypothetical protein